MAKPSLYLGDVGVIELRGADRLTLLQRLSTGDMRVLSAHGSVRETLFTTAQGRCFAWASVLAQQDRCLLVVAPDRAAHLAVWIDKYTIMDDVETQDVSAQYCHGVLWPGPNEALSRLSADAPSPLTCETLWGVEDILSWDGQVALGSPKMLLAPAAARSRLSLAAEAQEVMLVNQARWLERNLSAGIPANSLELEGEVNPFEMRLAAGAISWNKGCYIGQEVLSRLDSYDKVARLLMGIDATDDALRDALRTTPIASFRLRRGDQIIGRVSSLMALKSGCQGLATVKKKDATPGPVTLVTADGAFAATLVDRPFWQVADNA